MRQMCPYCGKLVELPDDAAGHEAPCPACNKPFAVPKTYTPSVNAAAEVKPTMPEIVPPGQLKEWGFTISQTAADWVPVIALTVALVSVLFFSWVGAFPGGYRVFAQSPLQALFASFDESSIANLPDAERGIRAAIKTNWLMLPFLLGLLIATVLAWLDRIFPHPTLATVPAPLGWLVKFHERRHLAMIALTGLSLALILVQGWRGLGLQQAVKAYAIDSYVKEHTKEADAADTSFLKQALDIHIGQEYGKFCIADTLASDIGMSALFLALVGLLLRWCLDRRGKAALPRFVLQY